MATPSSWVTPSGRDLGGPVRPRPLRPGCASPGQAAPTCRPRRPMRAWPGDVMPRPDPGDEKSEVTRQGTSANPPAGVPEVSTAAAASPRNLARATTLAFLVGCPGVTSPSPRGPPPSSGVPFVSPRDLMFTSSFSQVSPFLHRCHPGP